MKLSVVTSLYKSAGYIQEFHRRIAAAAQEFANDNYEIIMVNDGSPDDSLKIAVEISKADPHLVVINLSRNFGHHEALKTGLQHALGEYIFLIDVDLEEEPEWLLPFAKQMKNTGCDLVVGQQISRKGGWFERWSGALYYRLLHVLGTRTIPNQVTAKLMTRRFLNGMLSNKANNVDIFDILLVGFRHEIQKITKFSTSPSTYTLTQKINMALSGITSHSFLPLVFAFYLGGAISLMSLCYIVYLAIRALTSDHLLTGWASIVISIWFIGGVIIFFIGLVGIYIARIFSELHHMPVVVERIYGREQPSDDDREKLL